MHRRLQSTKNLTIAKQSTINIGIHSKVATHQKEELKIDIKEFQKLMKQLYFTRDAERGMEKTLSWLEDEVQELREALEKKDREEAGKEFADVLAWLASLANVVEIDLEKVALSKYDNKCPKCKQNPCDCPF